MKYDRISSGDDGESAFDEIDVALTAANFAPPAPPFDVSKTTDVARYLFFRVPVGWVGEAHPAPRRQLMVGLAGEVELSVSSGESRRYGPGSVVLLDDMTGQGHVARVVSDQDHLGLFVQLD